MSKKAGKKSNSGLGCLVLLVIGGVIWFSTNNSNRRSNPVSQSGPTSTPRGHLRQADYGESWPFTVSEGILNCEGGMVTFWSEGWTYAVNGLARGAMAQRGWRDVTLIWRDTPAGSVTPKVDLSWVITMGMDMCSGGQPGQVVTHTLAPTSTSTDIPPTTVIQSPAPAGNAPVLATLPAAQPARPGNCATAVAMGLSAQEAAQWAHLDRDGDGVACYGD